MGKETRPGPRAGARYCSPGAGGGCFAPAGTDADYHWSWTTAWPESTVKT